DAAPLVAAAVVAAAAAPLGRVVGRVVARLLFGDRSEPGTALARLGERLEASGEQGSPLHDSAETVAVTLRLPGVAVVSSDGREVSRYGDADGTDATSVPLRAGGVVEGELRVVGRAPGEALSRSDLAVLDDLARPLALALAADRLAREVRASRERAVVAREDERRRIRRELHDGLGPGLAAIGIQLDLAVAAPQERAEPAVGRARGIVDELVGEVRRIVHDLRPAALDELGLLGAVEDLALAAGGSAASVELEAVELPPLPAATEVAAYRIVQEALANALKHAQARRIRLRIEPRGAVLHLAVEDDGRGIAATATPGVGSSSMRDRATEIGGVLRREEAVGGGTIVIAELPLSTEQRGTA
ncbi:two-component sensor histidine kinase, partial [Schumannella luteola]